METQKRNFKVEESSAFSLIAGVAVGATVMYFWDPQRGKTRRAHLLDYTTSRLNRCQAEAAGTAEDLMNRAKGIIAKAGATLGCTAPADDATLADRVRSRMGHLTRHARLLESSVLKGIVTLRGKLQDERERRRIMDEIARIPGVKSVEVSWTPESSA